MTVNYLAVLVATVVQFILGAIWYTPLFGNMWGRIHGFDRQSKEAQEMMKKKMMPLLVGQFLVTIVTSFVFAIFITYLPQDWNAYGLAGFFWLGFVVPTQVSAVLFGGTDPRWIFQKILIMAGGSLVCLEAAALVLHAMR
jgi:hypothetical protein